MPRPRFENLDPEKRAQILLGAGREFAEHGYDGATINLILSHIGLSTGAAYYYFDNKADLFRATVSFHVDQFLQLTGPELAVQDREAFWKRVDALFELILRGSGYEPHRILGALRTSFRHSKELRDDSELVREFRRAEAVTVRLFQRGCELGAVRDDLPLGLVLRCLQALDEAFDEWLAEQPPEFGRDELIRLGLSAARALRRMLEPAPGES